MFAVLVAILLLAAAVAAIYYLLKSMGEDGVEVAAPGSCKSGRCGVRNGTAGAARCAQEEEQLAEIGEGDADPAAAEEPSRQSGRSA